MNICAGPKVLKYRIQALPPLKIAHVRLIPQNDFSSFGLTSAEEHLNPDGIFTSHPGLML